MLCVKKEGSVELFFYPAQTSIRMAGKNPGALIGSTRNNRRSNHFIPFSDEGQENGNTCGAKRSFF
jgi:hypothetical protein